MRHRGIGDTCLITYSYEKSAFCAFISQSQAGHDDPSGITVTVHSIMIPAPRHLEHPARAAPRHPIHQPMLAVDAAGPPAGEIAAQRFGLAGSAKRVAHALLEQRVDPFDDLGFLGLQRDILPPRAGRKGDIHGSISS